MLGDPVAHDQESKPTLLRESNAPNATIEPGPSNARASWARRLPAHLDDYICYTARKQEPVALTNWLQEESLGTPYPITNYVTRANFSVSHNNFLAAIIKET